MHKAKGEDMKAIATTAISVMAAMTTPIASADDKPLPEKPVHAKDAERPAQMKRILELACTKQRQAAAQAKTDTEREKAIKELQRMKCPASPPPTM